MTHFINVDTMEAHAFASDVNSHPIVVATLEAEAAGVPYYVALKMRLEGNKPLEELVQRAIANAQRPHCVGVATSSGTIVSVYRGLRAGQPAPANRKPRLDSDGPLRFVVDDGLDASIGASALVGYPVLRVTVTIITPTDTYLAHLIFKLASGISYSTPLAGLIDEAIAAADAANLIGVAYEADAVEVIAYRDAAAIPFNFAG